MKIRTPDDIPTIVRPVASRTTWLGQIIPAHYAVERGGDVVGTYPSLLMACRMHPSIQSLVKVLP